MEAGLYQLSYITPTGKKIHSKVKIDKSESVNSLLPRPKNKNVFTTIWKEQQIHKLLKILKGFHFLITNEPISEIFFYIAVFSQCTLWGTSLLVDEQGVISFELKALIELFPVEYDGSLPSLVATTQSQPDAKRAQTVEFTIIPSIMPVPKLLTKAVP